MSMAREGGDRACIPRLRFLSSVTAAADVGDVATTGTTQVGDTIGSAATGVDGHTLHNTRPRQMKGTSLTGVFGCACGGRSFVLDNVEVAQCGQNGFARRQW